MAHDDHGLPAGLDYLPQQPRCLKLVVRVCGGVEPSGRRGVVAEALLEQPHGDERVLASAQAAQSASRVALARRRRRRLRRGLGDDGRGRHRVQAVAEGELDQCIAIDLLPPLTLRLRQRTGPSENPDGLPGLCHERPKQAAQAHVQKTRGHAMPSLIQLKLAPARRARVPPTADAVNEDGFRPAPDLPVKNDILEDELGHPRGCGDVTGSRGLGITRASLGPTTPQAPWLEPSAHKR
mmetsp:Transcript_14907/g.42325  ORF Transcript_14907/g.42325 Transcript_14907/m.42325 type:complete len:238 (+) Transcript_14907:1071-1784(+)